MLRSMKGPKRVVKITSIIRNGFYNPITTDGTIVVANDIIASTYTTYTGTSHVEIADQKLLPFQTIAHLAYVPYQSFCLGLSIDLCNRHTELARVNQMMKWIYNQWSTQNEFVKFIFVIIYMIVLGSISLMLSVNLEVALLGSLFVLTSLSIYYSKLQRLWGVKKS